eukprot:TRINITY_DN15018_c0_g1_i2.p1 TRINITY_DN15018_c0_g1~~TRINITY_DN15018_c0_g1_i2.p1  ORF type:complete len:1045 (+),score=215.80 TRINITY_DN15018_c0_g1_i2:127-3261(+)
MAMSTTPLLSEANLPLASRPRFSKLSYDRQSLETGMVHLGVGAGYRALASVFTHGAIGRMPAEEAKQWGSVGVVLGNKALYEQLKAQDGLYSVLERGSDRTDVQLVGCMKSCLFAMEQSAEVLDLLCQPSVRIVSVTVASEFVYPDAGHDFDLDHWLVKQDLDAPEKKPQSAVGLIVRALQARKQMQIPPFTVLSCDNMPDNGQRLSEFCQLFAERYGVVGMASWIKESVCFPCSMVDCIAPERRAGDVETAAEMHLGGLRDEAMVVCEPFRQWVVEDKFGPLGRPTWEIVGVQMVRDASPFIDAKFQVLNACHSTLAYVGYLCGIEFMSQVMARSPFPALARALVEQDVAPMLKSKGGVDLDEYMDKTMARFENRALEHRTAQIAWDGSKKLPRRLLRTVRARLEKDLPVHVLALGVAAWMRYVTRLNSAGKAVRVNDRLSEAFAKIAESRTPGGADEAEQLAGQLFGITEIFGTDDLFVTKGMFFKDTVKHLQVFLSAESCEEIVSYISAFVCSLPAPARSTDTSTQQRLSETTLPAALRPLPALQYSRRTLTPGIVHLGVGAFHRAHQAVYTHRALSKMPPSEAEQWGIVGVSLRRPDVRDQLAPQDSLYTVHERSTGKTDVFIVGCLLRCLVAPENPLAVLELLARPSVRVVSLTVTEKGYCYEPASRKLDLKNADIIHDLAPENKYKPKSSIGFMVHALRLRRERGEGPFTVLPCDNLPDNGHVVAGICHDFALALEPDGKLAAWIKASVHFASTMVDCIVPATKATDIDVAAEMKLGGLRDEAMVVCEPFRQWVIEDNFGPLGRPPWETVGAQVVKEVGPFEEAKLSILNGSHSTLAYSGFLCGIEFIWQVMTRQPFQKLAQALVELDVIEVLDSPAGVDLRQYARAVLDRFENQSLEHRTFQIAMDGSQKLPQRILRNAKKRLDKGLKLHVMPFSVAAWMRYVSRVDAGGQAVRVQDPLAGRFAAISEELHASAPGDARALATRLLAVTEEQDRPYIQVGGGVCLLQDSSYHKSGHGQDEAFAYLTEFVESFPSTSI